MKGTTTTMVPAGIRIKSNYIESIIHGELYPLPCLNMGHGSMCVILYCLHQILSIPYCTCRGVGVETITSHHHQTKSSTPHHQSSLTLSLFTNTGTPIEESSFIVGIFK